MARAVSTPKHQPALLVVEDDADTRESLRLVLEDAGYLAHLTPSLDEALAALDEHVFALVMTDLFAHATQNRLDAATTLRDRAFPTPVAILSGWDLSSTLAAREGFAFVASKPFDIDDLLTSVAKALDTPLTEEQRRQVPLIYSYFTALSGRDWDTLLSYCADDIVYVVPGSGPFARVITGNAAFRDYVARRILVFPEVRFDEIDVYGTPQGLAARYHSVWRGQGQKECQQAGSVVFQLDGATIRQIGVLFNHDHLSALVATSTPETGTMLRDL